MNDTSTGKTIGEFIKSIPDMPMESLDPAITAVKYGAMIYVIGFSIFFLIVASVITIAALRMRKRRKEFEQRFRHF